MSAPTMPSRDIAPKEFFETWLPAEYERLARQLTRTPPDATLCVELGGPDGGVWTLQVSGGALTVTAGRPAEAHIAVAQSVEDWRAFTSAADGTPLSAASLETLLASPALGQLLTGVKGTLRFEVVGLEGRTCAAEVTFLGEASPHATISIEVATLDQIRAGTLALPQAFFAGKLQISGDAAFAMQVGMVMMTPAGP